MYRIPHQALVVTTRVLELMESNKMNARLTAARYRHSAIMLDSLLTNIPDLKNNFASNEIVLEWELNQELTVKLIDKPHAFVELQRVLRKMKTAPRKS